MSVFILQLDHYEHYFLLITEYLPHCFGEIVAREGMGGDDD